MRQRLLDLAGALELDLPTTARMVSRVPLLWNRSPEAAAAKVRGVADALGVGAGAAAALFVAVPALASINLPGVVRDRVDAVSDALGVTCAKVRARAGWWWRGWFGCICVCLPAAGALVSEPDLASTRQRQQQCRRSSDHCLLLRHTNTHAHCLHRLQR